MKLGKMIKRDAKTALRGSWGKAIAMIATIVGIDLCINVIDAATFQLIGYDFQFVGQGIFSYSENFFYSPVGISISLLFAIIRLILLVPLGLGMINWYLELTDRKRGNVSSIFWPYESRAAIRSILLTIFVSVVTSIVAFAAVIIPIVIFAVININTTQYALSVVLGIIGSVLLLTALLFVAAFTQRYALTHILLCEKYKLTTRQAIKQSVKYMKGHKWELVRFDLSFLPWFLPIIATFVMLLMSMYLNRFSMSTCIWIVLTLIVYVLTMLFLTPYMIMAKTIYCRYLYEYGVWSENQQNTAAPTPMGTAETQGTSSSPAVPEQKDEPFSVKPFGVEQTSTQLTSEQQNEQRDVSTLDDVTEPSDAPHQAPIFDNTSED